MWLDGAGGGLYTAERLNEKKVKVLAMDRPNRNVPHGLVKVAGRNWIVITQNCQK